MHRLTMIRTGTWPTILALFIILTGCRTYGGSESEEAIYSQMERMLERFEGDLARAQADLRTLESATPQEPVLEALSAHYAELVGVHEAELDGHRQLVQDLSPASEYRSLHRAYGAMIAEQSFLRQRYEGMLRFVYDAYSTDTTGFSAEGRRPYASVPPYYVRAANADRELSVREVLSRMQSGAALRPDFSLVLPEPASETGNSGEAGSAPQAH